MSNRNSCTNENINIKQIFLNISNNLSNLDKSITSIMTGGNHDEKINKKLKKYKKFVEGASRSVLYFKSLAEYYYRLNVMTSSYYQSVLQKLHAMKEKMAGMDSQVSQMSNQFQHNTEKIQMLEYFVDMIEKMAKNPTEIDLNIKSQLKDKILQYDTDVAMNFGKSVSTTKKFDMSQVGGEKTFEDLEQIITANEEKILNSFSNIEFLNNKMTSLNERMKQVIDKNDSLFKIRAEIEWIVNALEDCSDGTCDKKSVTHNFDKLWKIVNGIQEKIKGGEELDAKIVEYITGLEKYIGVLETQINSADRTVRALDIKNDTEVKEHVENLKTTLDAQVTQKSEKMAGGKLKELFGGLLMEEEYAKLNADKMQFVENLSLSHIRCEFNLTNLENQNYAKVVVLKTVIKKLNEVIEQFLSLCNKDSSFYDENSEFNFIKLWKETFKAKKTNYYSNLLEKKIAYKNVTIIAKNWKLEESDTILIETSVSDQNEIQNLIDLLEDTKSFYICANYLMAKYLSSAMVINDPSNPNIEKLNEILKEYGKNLHKATHLTFGVFSESYDSPTSPLKSKTEMKGGAQLFTLPNFDLETIKRSLDQERKPHVLEEYNDKFNQSGGAYNEIPHLHILPQEDVKLIKVDKNAWSIETFDMYLEYAEILKSSPEIKPEQALIEINKNVITKIKSLDTNIENLYEMVRAKLGETSREGSYDSLTKGLVGTDVNLEQIGEQIIIKKENQYGGKQLLGGAEFKPRLDPFKMQLVSCKDSIVNFAKSLIDLKEWMKKNNSGKISSTDSKLLLRIQKSIEHTVISGRNSYIKVIPMIFFVIEFPPHIYLNSEISDYYKFEYENQKIKYIHREKTGTESTEEYEGAHAAFFASNNKNGTSYLLRDPLIGLDKIIAVTSDKSKPVNKVINMMFALGASGTGKTTRYFGKSDSPNPNDKQGIVSFVIENAKSTGAIKTNVAYFVCYGQHDGRKQSALNELIIFFNSNKENEDKYMPYNMNISNSSTTGYTDFYVKLMKKQLNKLKYSDISKFLTGEIDNVSYQGTPFGPFRKIIEENQDIWMEPEVTPEAITQLFESLIGEQKKIYTVMPTKNNIESSRGHTCVLIRFTYEDGSFKYFPLFDMAGTENPKEVKDFFEEFSFGDEKLKINKQKLAKLMKRINLANTTIADDVNGKEERFQSLTDMLNKSELARNYVTKGQFGGQKGGVAKIKDLTTLANQDQNLEAEKFLGKLGKEGYYINHTIAMLIFAALCVGTSLNTTQVGDIDNFDGFEDALNQELESNYICLLDKESNECTNTRFILDKYGFSEILSKSCIWTQVLFSFLYWNSDTKQSYDTLCNYIYSNYYNDEWRQYLKSIMSYYFQPPKNVTDSYSLMSYMQDNTIYDGAIRLVEILENPLITDLKIEQTGVSFTSNNSNYLLGIQNDTVIASKVDGENGTTLPYIKVNGTVISNLDGYTEESFLTAIKSETHKQRTLHMLTYNLYKLHQILERQLSEDPNFSAETLNKDTSIKTLCLKIFGLDESLESSLATKGAINNNDNNAHIGYKILTEYKTIPETYRTQKPTTLMDSIMAISKDTKGKFSSFNIEDLQIKYINFLITKIKKFSGNTEKMANVKINKLKESIASTQSANIIKKITDAKIPKQSYDLFLMSGTGQPIEEVKMALSNSLIFSKALKDFVEFGQAETSQYSDSLEEYNQIKRIKDGLLSATKMTMMHLVTGQTYKNKMVENTLELCQILYRSTDLKL